MAKVGLSTGAEADLRAIGDYIALDDPARAISFVHELRQACYDLREFPRRFPLAPRFGLGRRNRVYGNYHIVYRVEGDRVTILTIVHAARGV